MALTLKHKSTSLNVITDPIDNLELSIYEMYSVIGGKLRKIDDIENILNYFDDCGMGQFGLYKKSHGGCVNIDIIKLN